MSEASVMIVDDDALVAMHLQKALISLGYTVVGIYASGEDAVVQADNLHPDVIIMDIMLRDQMDGIEAARIIREKLEIPVVFISAYSDDAVIKQASETEPYGYLVKPVNERELQANIEMALYKSRMDKQLKNLNEVIYAVRTVNQLITREKDIQTIIDETSRILVSKRNSQMVWIGLLNEDKKTFRNTGYAGKIEHGLEMVSSWVDDYRKWPDFFAEPASLGNIRICRESDQTPNPPSWTNDLSGLDVKSFCIVPIRYGSNIFGLLWVFAKGEGAFTNDEIELLSELSDDMGLFIQNSREEEKRRATEKAYHESEELLSNIIEQTGQMVYDYDVNKGRLRWFGAIEDLLGFEHGEFNETGIKEWEDRIHPDDMDVIALLDKAISEKGHYNVEYRFRHNNGTYHFIEDNGIVIPAFSGKGLRMIGTMKDITEKRQTEDALQKSEERFRQLFVDAPLPYQSLDNNGILLDVNKSWLSLLGYEEEEVIGHPLVQFIHPDSKESFLRAFPKFIARGETISVMDMVQKNGQRLTIEFAGRVGYDRVGKFKQTHCILKNITEQVEVERELMAYKEHLEELVQERTANLNKAASLLDATLESTPDGILVIALDGKITKVNRRFLEIFNLEDGLSNNTTYNILLKQISSSFITPETIDALSEMVKSPLNENKIEIELNNGKKYECYTFPQMQEQQVVGKVWTFSDITLRKKIEEDLTIAKTQAEMASRAKSEFLANMSHEIRTPMNAVIGFADILDRKVDQPELKNYVRSIKSSGHALLHIINDILDISKIEAGRMEIHMEPIRLQTVFTEIENIFSMKVSEKLLNFSMEIPKDFPFAIIIDELRLQQILMNIVGNAIKFTEKGSVKVKATFTRKSASTISLRIDVKDTGIGIDPENQKKLFQAFMQADIQDQKKYGGTGLGLYISKRFIEMMGGTIAVSGKPGKGSTFSLCFDEIETYEKALDNKQEIDNIDYTSLWFDNQIVLIVDDVETNRTLVKSMLADANLVLLEAHNGLEAVKMAKIYAPDLIFMDIRMPVMDGYMATQQIKADPELKRMAIVALTASTAEESADEKEMARLFDGYLRKPVLLSDVMGEMIKFLDFSEKKPVPIEEVPAVPKVKPKKMHGSAMENLEKVLRTKVLPLWDQLTKRISMEEAGNMANLLIGIGKEYGIEELNLFGEELLSQIRSDDATQIKSHLVKLPALLEEKQLLNS